MAGNSIGNNMPKAIRLINGKEVELDREIADLIVLMNKKGYTTENCCSGLLSDHPRNEYDPDELSRMRTYISCDLGNDYSKKSVKDKVAVLLYCLRGIGHIEIIEYEWEPGKLYLFIELSIRWSHPRTNKPGKLQLFHERFKEMTK
jgi:hypothetical protein